MADGRRHAPSLLSLSLSLFILTAAADLNSDTAKTLMKIKASFSDVDNALIDWDDNDININVNPPCSWRGVLCLSLSLVSLNLSNFNLGGQISPAICHLNHLHSIDFRGNKLTGQIPDEIGDCSLLLHLDLSENLLYGDIPYSISNLKQLQYLNLKNNQLTGPIPSSLTQIPNLRTLDLALNLLSGEIPRLLYWNEVLQYLGLRGNSLTGTLSPDMCQLTGLWFFDVRGNNLTGTIPYNIGNCTSFEILDISYNQITGEIPYNIAFLQVATLSLQGNRLTGTIPEVIGLMQALAVLDLSENELVGSIPAILGNLSYTGKLYLHGNMLTGPIPPEIGNMSKLSYLQLNDNQLTGTIPAELGKLEQLFELNLANNFLEGPIPDYISSCTALNQLNVHGNRLNGSIPSGLHNLGSLTCLNLSANNFRGKVSTDLGHIINLDTLDLSGNNFSGTLPPSIGGLEHLLILNLSRNNLEGPLPAEFGDLRSIQIMDISFNNLSGTIPAELGQLQNIQSLILNDNKLHGEIPDQLTNCFSLMILNVSSNNLSGVIPRSHNFTRFPSNCFNGNAFLCRNWFSSLCGHSAIKSQAHLPRTAVICMVFGFATLFSIVLVVIYKSKYRKTENKGSRNMQGPPKMVILHMGMAIHTFDDIMRITDNLSEKYIVGYGASSTVYRCELKSSRPFAIKRLHYYQNSSHEFQTELETIGSIRHRNIVSLHGYALSPLGNLLFYDFMENGSLWDLLHGLPKKVKLDWDTRLKIAVGAAQGLAYLHHDCIPRIIHRDIKSSNILLDENFEAHLSDFGIAKCMAVGKTHASTCILGTIGYIDPEYARTLRVTEKSDVYSFGIVLLELLTGKKAVENESSLLQTILAKAESNTIMDVVDPEVSVTCIDILHVKKVFQLGLMCTKHHPSDRPSMHQVSRVLVSLLPPLAAKKSSPVTLKPSSYGRFGMDGQEQEQEQEQEQQLTTNERDSNSCDAQWFLEVISENTL